MKAATVVLTREVFEELTADLLDRAVDVVRAAFGNRADDGLRGRVDDGDRAGTGRGHEGPVDVQRVAGGLGGGHGAPLQVG